MDPFRISTWEHFIGQDRLKARMRVHLDAAIADHRPLQPTLFTGKPGFGKTTLATIIAHEMNEPLTVIGMPVTDAALFRLCEEVEGVVLFDEIHAAPKAIQEALQPLLEFGYVQNRAGMKRYSANTTFVGATTEPDKLIKPFWDRWLIRPDFDPYTEEEMGRIVMAMAAKASVKLTKATAEALGRATGGTPRAAAKFVLAARDLTVHRRGKTPDATAILDFCRVDETGVTQSHLDYLDALMSLGGVAGLSTLRNYLHLNESVVTEMEPMLLDQKLIRLTRSGRELTRRGQLKLEGTRL